MHKRRRRSLTPQFKALVVLEVLAGLKSPSEIARKHKLEPELIARWKDTALVELVEVHGEIRRDHPGHARPVRCLDEVRLAADDDVLVPLDGGDDRIDPRAGRRDGLVGEQVALDRLEPSAPELFQLPALLTAVAAGADEGSHGGVAAFQEDLGNLEAGAEWSTRRATRTESESTRIGGSGASSSVRATP